MIILCGVIQTILQEPRPLEIMSLIGCCGLLVTFTLYMEVDIGSPLGSRYIQTCPLMWQ